MKRHDLAWRALGLAIVAAASAVGPGRILGADSPLGVAAFVAVLIGITLSVQGRRVAAAFRIELSRHRTLPGAIRRRAHGDH